MAERCKGCTADECDPESCATEYLEMVGWPEGRPAATPTWRTIRNRQKRFEEKLAVAREVLRAEMPVTAKTQPRPLSKIGPAIYQGRFGWGMLHT